MDELYSGISLVALVIGVTQVIKRAGLDKRYAQAVAITLAFLIFGGAKAVEVYPQTKTVFDIIFTGLYGMSAIGIYDVVKGKPQQPPEMPL